MPSIRVQRLHPDVPLPTQASLGAAGYDLSAWLPESGSLEIAPNSRVLVPTGLKVAIPPGYELQVRPRSGLALKKGLTVLNTPGTIDSDYRGEIGVILFNTSPERVVLVHGERVAQLVMNYVYTIDWMETDSLETTARAAGGFGSTGG